MNSMFKIEKLKSSTTKKVGRIVLWMLVVFLILRGIGTIVYPSQTKKILADVNKTLYSNSTNMSEIEDAAAFAQNFAIEYFTYKQGDAEGYKDRLSNYMNDESISSLNLNQDADIQAVDASAIHKSKYGPSSYDIDVKVKVKYVAKNTTKDLFLRVPITADNGKYLVEEAPLLIGKPNIADIKSSSFNGTAANNSVSDSIKDMLNNFLKAYCEGSSVEIKYYLSNFKQSIKGLNGNFKFKNIDDLTVYDMHGSYLAILGYTVQDAETQQEIKQRVHITIISKDNRFYVKDIQTRTNNIRGVK